MKPIETMTVEQYRAELPVWIGAGIGRPELSYDPELIAYWDMRQDPTDGTVYYLTQESERRIMVWCSGRRLDAHLLHLEQIKARRAAS